MDWSKAKSILILIFIVLNIFLMVNISVSNPGASISSKNIADAQNILKTRGVTVECDIPRYSSDTGMLVYEAEGYNKQKVIDKLLGSISVSGDKAKLGEELVNGGKKLVFQSSDTIVYRNDSPSESINIKDVDGVEKYLKEILSEIDLPASGYYRDMVIENTGNSITMILVQKFKDFIIYDNKVRVTIGSKGITYLECKYQKVKNMTSGKKILPAYQILLREFGSGSSAVITTIDIGFRGYKPEQDTKDFYENPVWRIKTKDGKEYFIKAIF